MNTATPDPESIIARLLGRHCAGAAHRPSPREMLDYLSGPAPKRPLRPIDYAARSLLNCSSVPDLLEVLVDCGVAPGRLAAHAQGLDVTNRPVLECLRQLKLPDSPAPEPGP